MIRYKRTPNGRVSFTPAEEAARDAEEAAWADGQNDRDWISLMAESDAVDIPRWLEDHIESDHLGKSDNAKLQERYDKKKAKRSLKPE